MNPKNPQHVHTILNKHTLIDNGAHVIDLEKSHGSWFVDARSGKEYLDCFSQFASQPVGWNCPRVLEQKERLLNAAIHKVANSDIYSQEYAQFVEKFASFCPDFKHFFFISGGALGVENALKAAFDWKHNLLGGNAWSKELDVIHLKEAFHGRTGYTLSLTNRGVGEEFNPKTKYFPKFNWTRITNPKIVFDVDGNCNPSVDNLEQMAIQEIEQKLGDKPTDNSVAAIIVEPIQGEGGDNHFRAEFFQKLREIANQHGIMLIFDEVQTGMGLTGKTWCYEHFNVVPDMICFGKKTQVCGFASTGRIDEQKQNVFNEQSRINSTWGGNIVDMVRSTIYMEIIEQNNLIQKAENIGFYFLELLRAIGCVENVRGRGLMIAFDMETQKERDHTLSVLSQNMLALPCGDKSIRFRPHLTFTLEDVDTAIEFIKKAL